MTTSTTTTAPYAELAAAMRGDLIVPGDPGYDQARAVYNAMIDKHPAAIARCRDAADVITCVGFAREHGSEIAVRGGGHNAAGLGVWDGALVIDLSLLRSTTVSPQDHTVRVDAGLPGATSTTRRRRSAWPPRPGSSRRPAWPG
jgi:FAD/FMN-containing dehydrogenase